MSADADVMVVPDVRRRSVVEWLVGLNGHSVAAEAIIAAAPVPTMRMVENFTID